MSSRAQHGMYIIGNAACASSVEIWAKVIGILQEKGRIGRTLRLRCPRHENELLEVSKPEDFEVVSPEGGCSALCGQRLECGHACEFLCHADVRHLVASCAKPCEKGRPQCGHACPKKCSDPCGKCTVPVHNVALPCGHVLPQLPCWKAQNLEETNPRCPTRLTRKLDRCGHEVEMECWQPIEQFECREVCGGALDCRHGLCRSPCFRCLMENGIRTHSPCTKVCGKSFTTCSHSCNRRCHPGGDCGLCQQRCELQCVHSGCTGICGANCVPCAEPCTSSCEHLGSCNMPCGAPCDRLPCNLRCPRLLNCGHQCPSICGEICPDSTFCQQCCSPELKETMIDYIELKTYAEIDLDEEPIVVLPCNHFCSRTTLDETLEMKKVYEMNQNGQFLGIIPNGAMTSQRPQCPQCRAPICKVQRYNRVIKRYILDTLLRSFISRNQSHFLDLTTSVDEFELALEESRDTDKGKLQQIRHPMQRQPNMTKNSAVISERLAKFKPLQEKIRRHLEAVNESKQPHMKVYSMSIAAQSRLNSTVSHGSAVSFPLDVPSPEVKQRLLATILELRLHVFRSTDMLQVVKHLSSLTGCNETAEPLYRKVIKECTKLRSKTTKAKLECDQHQYYSHAIELILLHTQLFALEVGALQVIDKSKISTLREEGLKLLVDCESYLIQYPSCKKFEPAVERARQMLRAASPIYEAMSKEERQAVYDAMRGQFGASVRWYYCANNHPVSFHEDKHADSSSR